MKGIKKILVEVYGSSHSNKAVDYAVHIAELEHAQLSLVYAIGDMHDRDGLFLFHSISLTSSSEYLVGYGFSARHSMPWQYLEGLLQAVSIALRDMAWEFR